MNIILREGLIVRDFVPQICEKDGTLASFKEVSGEELKKALRDKLVDAAIEYQEDPSTENLIEVFDITRAILTREGITADESRKIGMGLLIRYGDFRNGFILEKIKEK
jgi:predicted house-cleaning noncanonical NTP pyrophosphatase (MazG superfamily)